MPELPEVEVTRLGLLAELPGRGITSFWWSGKQLRSPMPLPLLQRYLSNCRLTTIDRRAKYLLFRLDNGAVLLMHLGMSGKLGLVPQSTPLTTHDHFRLLFDNNMEVRFNDTRRFGEVVLWPPEHAQQREQEFSARIGPEPFSEDFHAQGLWRAARSRRIAVKNFLMDLRMVAGIGNIYANEILFAVGIHPLTPASALQLAQWERIVIHSREILRQAIAAGGTTIADFLSSTGSPGYFQLQLQVYGREGEPCKECQTLIEKLEIGGRATYFCARCQVLDGRKQTSLPQRRTP